MRHSREDYHSAFGEQPCPLPTQEVGTDQAPATLRARDFRCLLVVLTSTLSDTVFTPQVRNQGGREGTMPADRSADAKAIPAEPSAKAIPRLLQPPLRKSSHDISHTSGKSFFSKEPRSFSSPQTFRNLTYHPSKAAGKVQKTQFSALLH